MPRKLTVLGLVLALALMLGAGAGCSSDDLADDAATDSTSQPADQDAGEAEASADSDEPADSSDQDAEDADSEPSREAEEQTQEHAADTSWTEPDPVPGVVVSLAVGSGFDPEQITGSVGARADRGDESWVRVDVVHSDPSYEGELAYLHITVGDPEWTVIDFGTGLVAADLEAQGVPADVAAEINPF